MIIKIGRYEIEFQFSRRLITLRRISIPLIIIFVFLFTQLLYSPFIQNKLPEPLKIKQAKAQYQYTATAGQINNSDGIQRYNSFNSTRAADGSTWTISPVDITGSDTSLDVETTIGGVQLQGANKMILTFRVSSSTTSLRYVFSIYDNDAGIWRPLNNHTPFNPADPGNLTNYYTNELVPGAANTLYVYQFEIFDGYFANTTSAPGSKITTELSDFISSNNVKLRVSSNDDCGTATWFLNWDFAQVEVAVDPGYAPSSVNKTTGTWGSRYYSDTFISNNAEAGTTNTYSLNIASSGNAVNYDFTFSGITPPYDGANTILLWYEGATSVANLSGNLKIYFWNYDTNSWEGTAVSSGNASSTTVNANRIMMFSTPLTNHISTSGATREAKIKIEASHSASFTSYTDWVKLVIGSTNDGSQQNNVSVGTASGSLSDAGNVDTTTASPALWTLNASNSYTSQYYGDTNSTYSVAADLSVPIAEIDNANITGVQLSDRTNCSSATPVLAMGVRDFAGGWSDFQTRAAGTAYVQHPYIVSGNYYRYPTWGSFGSASAATTALNTIFGQNPQDYQDTTNNFVGYKIRTTTGQTSTFSVGVDFAFLSVRYVASDEQFTSQYTPSVGVKNAGGTETNSWRYTKVVDSQYWTIAASAGVNDNVDLEFQGVTVPETWNRLIVNAKYSWGTASLAHNMQIYDYANSVWRPLGGHSQATTDYNLIASGTASTQQYYQFEIFDGYFRNTDATPGTAISTPVANFVGTGADLGKVKIKIATGTANAALNIDWAQIELAQDPTYYARSASFNGIGTAQQRFYSDIYYPDATVNTASPNFTYALGVTKATSGTDRLNTQLNFENVSVPYTQANAILLDTQISSTSANSVVSIQIYNFTNGNWNDTLNTGTVVPTASRYFRYQFIRPVSNWADYINPASPNDVRIRFYTTNTTAATFYIDYARITLGSITSAGESGDVTWGTGFLNDKTATSSLNTTAVPSLTANTGNAWYVNSQPDLSAGRTLNSLSSAAANVSFSVDRPADSIVTGIKWANIFSSNTGWTVQVHFRDYYGDYTYANPNAQYIGWSGSTTANPGMAPTAADANSLASATQTLVSGLNQYNPEDKIDTQANKINMALRTSASTLLTEQNLIWDAAFVSIRYVKPPASSSNTNPDNPSSLAQKKTNDSEISIGGWTNESSVKYTATVTDPDSDQVQICVEKDQTGTAFSGTEDLCGDLVDSGQSASVTIGSQSDGTEYHWQARTKDSNGAYSSWVTFGGNGDPDDADYGVDTSAPTGGTVYDGLAGDQDWNDGTLNSISANWTGFNPAASGLARYEYAVRRESDNYYWNNSPAGWQLGAKWFDNGTGTSATVTPIYLNTSDKYYFSVRVVDNAGNTASPVNSNGQQVLPFISYSYDTNTITFANLNDGNGWSDSKTNQFTVSTNAFAGFTIAGFMTQAFQSITNPSITIDNYSGTWEAPTIWSAGQYGLGYTSSDTLVQGSDRFAGATKYAHFTDAAPGNIVADHTDAITGQTGTVTDEQHTITYKVAVSENQTSDTYQTFVIYSVTANY